MRLAHNNQRVTSARNNLSSAQRKHLSDKLLFPRNQRTVQSCLNARKKKGALPCRLKSMCYLPGSHCMSFCCQNRCCESAPAQRAAEQGDQNLATRGETATAILKGTVTAGKDRDDSIRECPLCQRPSTACLGARTPATPSPASRRMAWGGPAPPRGMGRTWGGGGVSSQPRGRVAIILPVLSLHKAATSFRSCP